MKEFVKIFGMISFLALICVGIAGSAMQKTAGRNNSYSNTNSNRKVEHCFKINENIHDFGKVTEGMIARTIFKLTNCGKDTWNNVKIIDDGCGCSTIYGKMGKVLPKETREIKYEYGSNGRPGYFQKSAALEIDGLERINITITGYVVYDSTLYLPRSKN